jgi:predicted amidohydrolase
MLTTFAFLNNCYVLRANRVGKWEEWKFYGESFLSGPDGNIIDKLEDKEELLIVNIDKNMLKLNKKEWGFNKLRKDIKGLE